MNIVIFPLYFPPINSSGAKRMEAMSKYFVRYGHNVTVITPTKSGKYGEFTEQVPQGVFLIELNSFGRKAKSNSGNGKFEPMYSNNSTTLRRLKDIVFRLFGQVLDPRILFAISIGLPWLTKDASNAMKEADVVIGTTPPWPMLLAALICKYRFKVPAILDYRDHLSECHEMPGSKLAKDLEVKLDRWLVKTADGVVCISEPMSKYYRGFGVRPFTIMNGFEPEAMEIARKSANYRLRSQIIIRYMGLVSPGRVPRNFMEALSRLCSENQNIRNTLKIQFFGYGDVVQKFIKENHKDLFAIIEFYDSVSYLESLEKMIDSDYLLFSETSSKESLSAQGILTTKLFEYLGSRRPIIADISSSTLAGSLILASGEHHIVADSPEKFLDAFRMPNFWTRCPDRQNHSITKLSRDEQAQQYIELIKEITNRRAMH